MISTDSHLRKLKSLANNHRLQIVKFLQKHGSSDVGTIAKAIRMSSKATSQHLHILGRAEILSRRKRGVHVFYRLALKQEKWVREVVKETRLVKI